MKLIKPVKLSLRNHPTLNEQWIQSQIADDPTILGLGDLTLRDRERPQPRAGRLDLLLQDSDTKRRYEVEIQLGKADESHIIRTIEYWDIERKRYPQYEHCAVIIAEDITSRFLNVIGLFNGFIPLIAIQMTAFEVPGGVGLLFTKVLDELTLGLVDEDEDVRAEVDRAYWEQRATKTTVGLADALLTLTTPFAPGRELKYNKYYIGLAHNGRPDNFVTFRPKKSTMRLEPRLKRSEELDAELDASDLDVMEYDRRWNRYRIRLTKGDIKKHEEILVRIMQMAYNASGGEA